MRTASREQQFNELQRLVLVEQDLDDHDQSFDRLAAELAKIKGILIGILISVTTAAIMLAVNLVVA